LIVVRELKEDSLYIMQENLSRGKVNVVYDNSNLELWYGRLEHIREEGLQILAHKELNPDLEG